jgi:hypothetical protein
MTKKKEVSSPLRGLDLPSAHSCFFFCIFILSFVSYRLSLPSIVVGDDDSTLRTIFGLLFRSLFAFIPTQSNADVPAQMHNFKCTFRSTSNILSGLINTYAPDNYQTVHCAFRASNLFRLGRVFSIIDSTPLDGLISRIVCRKNVSTDAS